MKEERRACLSKLVLLKYKRKRSTKVNEGVEENVLLLLSIFCMAFLTLLSYDHERRREKEMHVGGRRGALSFCSHALSWWQLGIENQRKEILCTSGDPVSSGSRWNFLMHSWIFSCRGVKERRSQCTWLISCWFMVDKPSICLYSLG